MGGRGAGVDWRERVEDLNRATSSRAERAFERGERVGVREFLWCPLRAFVRGWIDRGGGSRFESAVVAGYTEVLFAAKLWEATDRWRRRSVAAVGDAGRRGVVVREWWDVLAPILEGRIEGQPVEGGRGGTVRVTTERGPAIVRQFRRGGMMRWAKDRYLGWGARPLREFDVLIRARRRGLPVPEPLAAMVERGRFGLTYRGWLVMAEIEGAESVWESLRRGVDRGRLAALGRAVRRIHDAGLVHRDLNLTNILVVPGAGGEAFVFVDLDGARLERGPVPARERSRSRRRIRRSARRLDPQGSVLGSAELAAIEQGYGSTSC